MQNRINNCIKARNACGKDTWAYNFWDNTLNELVRKASYQKEIIMPKNDITTKWFYEACKTQSNEWLVNNSQRTDGLFHDWQMSLIRKVMKERGLITWH